MIPNLQDLDLTWTTLSNSQAIELGETLTRSAFLKSVNLSFCSVSNRKKFEENDEGNLVKSLV
jgi:hypothetical protein